jgi:phage shock protein PspC (stress-responsive transcriptional regulator)
VADRSSIQRDLAGRGLVRPRRGRVLAGVLAGIANRFGVSANLLRLLFIVSILLPGPQFIVYIVLWIIMPSE